MNHNTVILSLASNRFQARNLSKARQCLGEILYDLHFTSELWTEPYHSSCRDAYLNQLAKGLTTLDETQLNQRLKALEVSFGRTPTKRRLGIVPIDLDILSFNHEQRHERDWERPYIQALIDQIAPEEALQTSSP